MFICSMYVCVCAGTSVQDKERQVCLFCTLILAHCLPLVPKMKPLTRANPKFPMKVNI